MEKIIVAQKKKRAARRLARARAIGIAALIDEAETAEGAQESQLIREAIRQALNAAAGLEQLTDSESRGAAA